MTAIALRPRNQTSVLWVASVISSLVMLDSNIVAVALPSIASSLTAEFSDIQWVITAYVLPFAALLLAAGSFADRVGRRKAVLIGQAVFALASLLCGLATQPWMLNAARALQGVGASLLLTAALAIINHNFRGPERVRAYAFWGASLGIAITSGPILGGAISSLIGWQWAFLINVPLCAGLMVATLRVVPESRDPEAKRMDYLGAAMFSSGLFLLTWGVIDGNALGWATPQVMRRLAGGAALLAAFVFVERAQDRPMIEFGLFRSRALVGSTFAMVGYAAGAQVMIFYLPLYLQNAYGFTPLTAGLAMLPFALPMFLAPRLVGKLSATWPSRSVLALGLTVSAIANGATALLATGGSSYLAFAVAMVAAGTGAGLLNGETAKALQGALPAERSGMASGLGATVRFTALLFAVAGLGAVLISVTVARFTDISMQFGLRAADAAMLAKRFAGGDGGGALSSLPAIVRNEAADALRQTFDLGFGAAAWTAAAVALLAMVLTWLLLPKPNMAMKTRTT